MKRASETSRSILRQYRALLCAAAVAAFTVCLSPKAFAQYNPSTVSCLSGGYYQAPQSAPANPTADDDAEFVADNNGQSGSYTVHCTWSGFPAVVTQTPMTLHVTLYYTTWINGHRGPNTPLCTAGNASVHSNSGLSWNSSCVAGTVFKTATVPSGTDLSTISVTGATSTGNVSDGTDLTDFLNISTISIY